MFLVPIGESLCMGLGPTQESKQNYPGAGWEGWESLMSATAHRGSPAKLSQRLDLADESLDDIQPH